MNRSSLPVRSRERARAQRGGRRRSLSNLGGPVEVYGCDDASTRLATIMGGDMDEDGARSHVHGFHSYPARMHPTLALRCVELLSPPDGIVFDPFCGSGTVLVESRLAARKSYGVDINPLAVMLARVKSQGATPSQLRMMVSMARAIAESADTRRREKRGASRRYPDEDVQLFEPHVLLELDGLREGLRIAQEQESSGQFVHDALRLVLSSILVKVSRKAGDSSSAYVPRRLAAGFTILLFEQKAAELAKRVDSYTKRLPSHAPIAWVQQGDARRLDTIPNASAHLVLSSPPYVGTYDYADHHRLRQRWLGLRTTDTQRMQRDEVGARRHIKTMQRDDVVYLFQEDLTNVLRAASAKLLPNGKVALLIADSVVGGEPVWVEPLVRRCGQQAGFTWLATASQGRPHFHGSSKHAFDKRPRKEHLILLAMEGAP